MKNRLAGCYGVTSCVRGCMTERITAPTARHLSALKNACHAGKRRSALVCGVNARRTAAPRAAASSRGVSPATLRWRPSTMPQRAPATPAGGAPRSFARRATWAEIHGRRDGRVDGRGQRQSRPPRRFACRAEPTAWRARRYRLGGRGRAAAPRRTPRPARRLPQPKQTLRRRARPRPLCSVPQPPPRDRPPARGPPRLPRRCRPVRRRGRAGARLRCGGVCCARLVAAALRPGTVGGTVVRQDVGVHVAERGEPLSTSPAAARARAAVSVAAVSCSAAAARRRGRRRARRGPATAR